MALIPKYAIATFILTFLLLSTSCKTANDKISKLTIDSKVLDSLVHSKMDSLKIVGLSLAVIEKDNIMHKGYYGNANLEQGIKVDSKTIFEAASISKSVFAYFTMKMVEQEKLNLDLPLAEYLPLENFEDHPYAKILTARMVLAHKSGLPNWRFLEEDGALKFMFEPGTSFNYSGEGYEYLADVLAHINNVDRQGLETIIQEEIFNPLNMKNSGFITTSVLKKNKAMGYEGLKPGESLPDELPYFGAAFNLVTNVDDFSKFVLALLQEQNLNSKLYKEMFSSQAVLPADESLRIEDGFDSWGLGFMRAKEPYGLKIAHGGINPSFQGYFMLVPEKDFGFVFFTNSTNGLEILPYLEDYFEKNFLNHQ